MPSWLRVRGEFRERVEGFENSGFTAERDDSYALSRVRLNATITASKSLSFQANVQDARVAKKQVGPTTAPFRGPFDLRTGVRRHRRRQGAGRARDSDGRSSPSASSASSDISPG